MGTNTLETAYSNGQIIDASHINELTAAVINQFVGRNTSGVPEVGKSLGTAAIPWGAIHASSLLLDGLAVDTSQITSVANRVVSGATRADSDQPDFLRADGTIASMTLLGASTNLTLAINGVGVTVSTDIIKTGLTLAPAANNTCLVNDATMINDLYAGESDANKLSIIVDTMGSEITAKIGEYVGLQTATGEIMYAFVKSATELTNVFRGFFFNDGGAPIVRGNLSDNDTLTLINIGWVFVEDNGTTVDVSYIQPVYSYEAPSGPATGQYWFDIPNQVWKRYSGTEFEIINRMIIGVVAMDDTAAIATRSGDFTNNFEVDNNVAIELNSNEVVLAKELSSRVNVYGTKVIQDLNKLSWNITTDLETGISESVDTLYYLYVSTEGQRVISNEKPYYRADLKGHYHPYHTWRCIGEVYNDSGNNFDYLRNSRYNKLIDADKTVIRLDSVTGRGSTNTAINIYDNITEISENGAVIEYETSATDGDSFTVKRRCIVEFEMTQRTRSANGTGYIGASLNSTQLTTSVDAINVADRIAAAVYSGSAGIAHTLSAGSSVELEAGDIVRPHTNGGAGNPDTPALCQVHMVARAID